MGVFRFKQFDVVNERSAMKVNTDGVLLGAAMTIMPEDRRFLDIGTGTGTIALMAAQRAGEMPGQTGHDKAQVPDDIKIDAICIYLFSIYTLIHLSVYIRLYSQRSRNHNYFYYIKFPTMDYTSAPTHQQLPSTPHL